MLGRRSGASAAGVIAAIAVLGVLAALLFPRFYIIYAGVQRGPIGVVLDAAGRPLPGAVLRFRDKAGNVVDVDTADQNGRFLRRHLGALSRNAIDGFAASHFLHCTGGSDEYFFAPFGIQDVHFRNTQGKPVVGLPVAFQPDQRTWQTTATPESIDLTTDPSGTTQITNVPLSARFDITSRDPRFVVQSVQTQASSRSVRYAVTVVPSATITGRLLSAGGTPLGGCYAFAASAPDTDRSARRYAMGVTGANGRFRIQALSPGTYYVSAKPPLDYHYLAPARRVTVASGGTVEVTLRARGQ